MATITIGPGITLGAGITFTPLPSYFIGILAGSSTDQGNGIAFDSAGNFYVTGTTSSQGAGSVDVLLAKYNSSGTIQWQRTLGGASSEYGFGVAVDSSGNVYVTGYTSSQGAGSNDFLIAKYNTSGTIQWQRTLGGGTAENGRGIAVDSGGNVYVSGYTGSSLVIITKYNTSGTIQWQRTLGSGLEDCYGIAVDSSGNVYVTGSTSGAGAGIADVLIAKYDTSGTIQWQRVLGGGAMDLGYGVAVDSSSNVYVTGYTRSQGAGGSDILIAKYNSSGTIQWQRILGGSGDDTGYGIAVDSSGNVYVTGTTSGSNDVSISKYDTSGTIQWQRTLGGSGNDTGYGIAVGSNGDFYVTGITYSPSSGAPDVILAKLPGDGSKTGTYTVGGTSFTYAASTLTAATSTLTSATSSLASSTSSYTDASASLTSSTSTLTSTVTKI
jgi:uncharacterized delta-60 repeat protein